MITLVKQSLADVAECPVENARKQRCSRQRKNPARGDVAHRREAEPVSVRTHRSGDTRTENMRGAYRQSEFVGGEDGSHGDQSGACSLGVGQMVFADAFAHSDHHALPSNHGAETQRKRYGHLDPGGNKFGGVIHLVFVAVQSGLLI